MKRILNIDFDIIDTHQRHRLFSDLLAPEFLAVADERIFTKIRERMQTPNELDIILDRLRDSVRFNSFHYHLLRYYRRHCPDESTALIFQRIEAIRITPVRQNE